MACSSRSADWLRISAHTASETGSAADVIRSISRTKSRNDNCRQLSSDFPAVSWPVNNRIAVPNTPSAKTIDSRPYRFMTDPPSQHDSPVTTRQPPSLSDSEEPFLSFRRRYSACRDHRRPWRHAERDAGGRRTATPPWQQTSFFFSWAAKALALLPRESRPVKIWEASPALGKRKCKFVCQDLFCCFSVLRANAGRMPWTTHDSDSETVNCAVPAFSSTWMSLTLISTVSIRRCSSGSTRHTRRAGGSRRRPPQPALPTYPPISPSRKCLAR